VGRKRERVRVIRKNQQQTISHNRVFGNIHYLKPFVYTVVGINKPICPTLVITYKACHIYGK
jgi:hypothetical protein